MHFLEDTLILSPSDLAESLACEHLVAVELSSAKDVTAAPTTADPNTDLLSRRGDEHEQRYLEQLTADGRSVVEVSIDSQSRIGLEQAEGATLEAMRSGADVVYQATFFDGRWRGQADFLERVDLPSDLGNFSYEVVDTKLAQHAKVSALLQISNYSEHAGRLQGAAPAQMHLQLGNGTRATFSVRDFDAYYRTMKRRFEELLDNDVRLAGTYPDPVSHCAVCSWADVCAGRRTDDDHLSLVAGMGRSQIEKLRRVGVVTAAAFAQSDGPSVLGIGTRTLDRLRSQARLQIDQRTSGDVTYELLEPAGPNLGLGGLPAPSPGDLFFDMEGDPYVGHHGVEYLFGVIEVVQEEPVFHRFWGHTPAEEKAAFEAFVDFMIGRLDHDPNLHIFHYAHYETTAMKKLAARHDTREAEIDRLLRAGVFIDLYRIVKQSLRVSQPSYSIKKLEPLYMAARETEVVSGAESIVMYETWLETGDQTILDNIEAYNKDDCESTLLLRNWLEERRLEASARFGDIDRPKVNTATVSEELTELEERIRVLEKSLCSGDAMPTSPDEQTRWLLSQLLEWHRRERKADWWRYFELTSMSDDELFEDREALAGLAYVGVVDEIKSSLVHRYQFDPQDHKIGFGSTPIDPITQKGAGAVVFLDDDEGFIHLKRGKRSEIQHLSAVIPAGPRSYVAQQSALLNIGQWVAENGLHATTLFRSGLDLLRRQQPRLRSGRSIDQVLASTNGIAEGVSALAVDLDSSCLAIQGPPGSGKTYSGAQIVLALVRQGKRVAITATGHKVIGNLLEEVSAHARAQGHVVRLMQKAEVDDRCYADDVECTNKNEIVDHALAEQTVDVVGGTAWLFSRPELQGAFDVLIVDEAGQFSLADALAVSTSANSMILLGDPQQLAQPSKGVHPEGAGASALAHLLGGHQTMPPDLGVLLDRSWRMHPSLCAFVSDTFYEGRLRARPECGGQSVEGDEAWSGAGLRYIPVEHAGNKTSSEEEAKIIDRHVRQLLEFSWTNRDGVSAPVDIGDILVVAPYNAQVSLLRRVLPDGARVGTVDKFQGQEAAVVFYSLAASTPEDISRGMEFLYSTNRLNVAVSRARCLAFLVGSPALLTIAARTPADARRVNALCAAVEHALPVVE